VTAAPAGSSNADLRSRIIARVERCLAQSMPLCRRSGVPLPQPEVRFDLHGLAAGQCLWQRRGTPVLRFNLSLAGRHPNDFVTTTVAHEVAHLITIACHGRTPPHGAEWRAVMRHLGISDPQRCHRYAVEESGLRRQRRWAYVCDCREHQLSTTRHNRIWRDQAEYLCRCCGSRLRPAAGESVPSV
jgi:SprT protein